MNVAKRTVKVLCPECEEEINLGFKPRKGQKVECPECESPLVVVNLSPPELSWDPEDPYDDWDSDREW